MKLLINIFLTFSLASCANYRTNTSIDFDTTEVPDHDKSIIISESDIKDREYTIVSDVEAVVKKLTLFHDRPTNEQANYVLRYIAKKKKGDAVIKVKYDYGIGFFSWGVLTAEGVLIRFNKDKK